MILSFLPYNVHVAFEPEEEISSSGSVPQETETETSTSVSSETDLLTAVNRTNDLLSGIIFFIGVVVGVVGLSVFFGRFRRE